MASRKRRELFPAPVVEVTRADQDRTNTALRKCCEGRFEIAIGAGTHNNELHIAPGRLQVRDDGWGTRKGRVRKKAERGSIGCQLAEQLQSFRRQLSR